MHIKLHHRKSGLAFLGALILFIIIVAIVAVGIAMLAKVANRAVNGNPGDGGGPTTNTPPSDTFINATNLFADMNITQAQLDALLAMASGESTNELPVIILRSTNLVHWDELLRTNTVNGKVMWDDPNPPYPNGFYRPLIVLP